MLNNNFLHEKLLIYLVIYLFTYFLIQLFVCLLTYQCYPKCGKGMSTRMVYCVGISNKEQKYPDELCDNSSQPISKKECFSEEVCPAMWHASQWSKVRERNTVGTCVCSQRSLHDWPCAFILIKVTLVINGTLLPYSPSTKEQTASSVVNQRTTFVNKGRFVPAYSYKCSLKGILGHLYLHISHESTPTLFAVSQVDNSLLRASHVLAVQVFVLLFLNLLFRS